MLANSHPPARWKTAIIVMGVSGAGKSTVASRLALRLDRLLVEGDSLHPAQNVEKMKHGIPLADADRLPWLKAIAARIDAARGAHQQIVVTCSALKRAYRETLIAGKGDVGFCGNWTLEISVKQPVKVYKGMPVGQLIYFPVDGEILVKYNQKKNAKYNGQADKPIESMMWKNSF